MSHDAHSSDRLGDGQLTGQDFEPGLGHTMPVPTLNKVITILVTLTVITVAASRVNFGHWNVVIALVIATIKAAIVVSFFMHLKFEGTTILMYVFYPLIVLFLFIGGSFVDVATRFDVKPVAVAEKLPQPVIAGGHGEGHGASHSAATEGHEHGSERVEGAGQELNKGGIDGAGRQLGGHTPQDPDHATMDEDNKTHP